MPFKAHTGISHRHAASIIYDLYKGTAGIFYEELDVIRTGIDCIFKQFLHCRSRTLNNLTRSYLVGYGIRE